MRFLHLYQMLARQSYDQCRALFVLMPKAHICHHVFDGLVHAGEWCFNPLTFAVQISEDYIGKKSRLARRVAPTQVIVRVLERSLQVAWKYWTDAGFIKG